MNSLAVSSKRVQRFEGKLNICKGKQLSVPERAGVTSLVGKKTNKLKIAGDNVNLKHECTENVADIFFLLCVKYIFFWFYQSVGIEANIESLKSYYLSHGMR